MNYIIIDIKNEIKNNNSEYQKQKIIFIENVLNKFNFEKAYDNKNAEFTSYLLQITNEVRTKYITMFNSTDLDYIIDVFNLEEILEIEYINDDTIQIHIISYNYFNEFFKELNFSNDVKEYYTEIYSNNTICIYGIPDEEFHVKVKNKYLDMDT